MKMKKYFNTTFIKILISIILFGASLFFKEYSYIKLILLILSYTIVSYTIYIEAFNDILKKEIFNENFLMIIATLCAFCIGEYSEAVMVILLFEIGEYLSDLAVNNSKKSIVKLLDLRSDYVNLKTNDKVVKTDIKKVKVGDLFIVKPGEKVPLDGIVVDGDSFVDTSSLTGESVPRRVGVNEEVLSGYINNNSIITVKSSSVYKTTTAYKIVEMIEKSNDKKSDTENFIRKFCKIYTPIVIICAILLALCPTLLGEDFNTWLYRGLVFLVTSCPCALVISVPLGYFCAIGRASKEGILIKGSRELDKLRDIKYVLFDKTGTITKGCFSVSKVVSIDKKISKDELLKIVSSVEEFSNHPISKAIGEVSSKIEKMKISNFEEIPGYGLKASVGKKKVLIGNTKLMDLNNIDYESYDDIGTIVYVAINSKCVGYIVVSDEIRKSSYSLSNLKKLGIKDIVMLSGDREIIVSKVAKKLKINSFFGELLPTDKVDKVKEYKKSGKVMFVGDGVNDALVLKASDIGVSMGKVGSDVAIEASDVVLMRDNLRKIEDSIKLSILAKKLISISIGFALTVKFIVLLFAIFGISTIWMAVFADVGVTLLSVLNVLRIMWKKI